MILMPHLANGVSRYGQSYGPLLAHICCAIMTIPEACVARRLRETVNSSVNLVKKLSDFATPDSSTRGFCRSNWAWM